MSGPGTWAYFRQLRLHRAGLWIRAQQPDPLHQGGRRPRPHAAPEPEMLLLFVSFLAVSPPGRSSPTHLFASNLSFHEITVSSSAERVRCRRVSASTWTLAALRIYLMLPQRRTQSRSFAAPDDIARGRAARPFARERPLRQLLLQAGGRPLSAPSLPLEPPVIFYLTWAVSIFTNRRPRRRQRARSARRAPPQPGFEGQKHPAG